MDINSLVKECVNEMDLEQLLKEEFKERIQEVIKSIVKSYFGTWSDFSKNLEEKFEKELKINLDEIKLNDYNASILNTIQKEISQISDLTLSNELSLRIKSMLQTEKLKESYDLEDIIEMFKEDHNDEAEENRTEEFTLIIEEGSYSYVYFDEDPKTTKYSCDYRISIKNDKIYSLEIKGKEIDQTGIIFDEYHKFDLFLKRLFIHGIKITNINENIDNSYDWYE